MDESKIVDHEVVQEVSSSAVPQACVPDESGINRRVMGTTYWVRIESIHLDQTMPYRQLKDVEADVALIESVRTHGVIEPLTLTCDDEKYVLVGGARRLQAAKRAGAQEVPAYFVIPDCWRVVAVLKNLQRKQLDVFEESAHLVWLVREGNYKKGEVAALLSKPASYVSEAFSLNALPDEITEDPEASKIPRSILVEIARIRDEEHRSEVFKRAKMGEMKRKDVRRLSPRRGSEDIALDAARQMESRIETLPSTVGLEALQAIKSHLIKMLDAVEARIEEEISAGRNCAEPDVKVAF